MNNNFDSISTSWKDAKHETTKVSFMNINFDLVWTLKDKAKQPIFVEKQYLLKQTN